MTPVRRSSVIGPTRRGPREIRGAGWGAAGGGDPPVSPRAGSTDPGDGSALSPGTAGPVLGGKLGDGSKVVAPHDRHGRANAHAREQVLDVDVRHGDATVRPIAAAAALAMDLDETADARRTRQVPVAPGAVELGAVLRVGIV